MSELSFPVSRSVDAPVHVRPGGNPPNSGPFVQGARQVKSTAIQIVDKEIQDKSKTADAIADLKILKSSTHKSSEESDNPEIISSDKVEVSTLSSTQVEIQKLLEPCCGGVMAKSIAEGMDISDEDLKKLSLVAKNNEKNFKDLMNLTNIRGNAFSGSKFNLKDAHLAGRTLLYIIAKADFDKNPQPRLGSNLEAAAVIKTQWLSGMIELRSWLKSTHNVDLGGSSVAGDDRALAIGETSGRGTAKGDLLSLLLVEAGRELVRRAPSQKERDRQILAEAAARPILLRSMSTVQQENVETVAECIAPSLSGHGCWGMSASEKAMVIAAPIDWTPIEIQRIKFIKDTRRNDLTELMRFSRTYLDAGARLNERRVYLVVAACTNIDTALRLKREILAEDAANGLR